MDSYKKYWNNMCPCGGGQSCIVDRRKVGDWVQEDDIYKKAGLKIRKNCYSTLSYNHKFAFNKEMTKQGYIYNIK